MSNILKLSGTSENIFDIGLSPKQTLDASGLTADRLWKFPDSNGTSGYALTTDGSGNLSWSAATATPAGSDTQIQYNNSGAFGASANLTWTDSTETLGVGVAQISNAPQPSTPGRLQIIMPDAVAANPNAANIIGYTGNPYTGASAGYLDIYGPTQYLLSTDLVLVGDGVSTYTTDITVDGGSPITVSFVGNGTTTTVQDLINTFNTALSGFATTALGNYNPVAFPPFPAGYAVFGPSTVRITSDTTGLSSSVTYVDGANPLIADMQFNGSSVFANPIAGQDLGDVSTGQVTFSSGSITTTDWQIDPAWALVNGPRKNGPGYSVTGAMELHSGGMTYVPTSSQVLEASITVFGGLIAPSGSSGPAAALVAGGVNEAYGSAQGGSIICNGAVSDGMRVTPGNVNVSAQLVLAFNSGGFADQSTIFVNTWGIPLTLTEYSYSYVFLSLGTTATFTITLPSFPIYGQCHKFMWADNSAITAITWVEPNGHTLYNFPVTKAAGGTLEIQYFDTTYGTIATPFWCVRDQ